MAVFQSPLLQPQTPPLRGSLSSGFNPRKTPRGFAPLPRRRFERGLGIFKDKHHADFDFEFKEASAAFKNVTGKLVARQHLYRWLEPAAGQPVRADILRLSPWQLEQGHPDSAKRVVQEPEILRGAAIGAS